MPRAPEPQRSRISEAMEGLGWLLTAAVGVALLGTIAAVWINGYSLGDTQRSFADFRNQFLPERVRSQEARVSALEAAWNKEHPDAKLGPPTSTGTVWYSTSGSQ